MVRIVCGGGVAREKRASHVSDLDLMNIVVDVAVPAHAPDHPLKTDPALADAVNFTLVFLE